MVGLLVALLIIYVIAAIFGLAIHGLVWLFWIAVILFVITVIARALQGGNRRVVTHTEEHTIEK
jgi:hypothetical protein